jgi:hypothetical protein
MLADADFVVSVIDVAVTVTVFPGGTVAGAVYLVPTSSPVVAGLKDPQPVPPHVTVHVTSGFALTSLVIEACSGNSAFTSSEAGSVPLNATEIGIGGTIVIVIDLEREVFAIDVAVTVTVAPLGTAGGAEYTIAPNSSLAFSVPHAFGLPQLTAYVTAVFAFVPAGEENSVTASIVAFAFTARDVGGASRKMTEIGVGS